MNQVFTVAQLCRTSTGIANVPGAFEQQQLIRLIDELLVPITAIIGPINVTSGFRCNEVNRAVGGEANSQHLRGEACDWSPTSLSVTEAFILLRKMTYLPICQAIMYPSRKIIHTSIFPVSKINQWLVSKEKGKYEPYLQVHQSQLS